MDTNLYSDIFSSFWGFTAIILFLGGSIFIHEMGHFIAARKRGLKVERFSIGFGPKIFGWTKDGIDYRISLLPFGGYVALPQLADMSMIEGESELEAEELPPISYADKMIVSVMGVVFNLIFAFFLSVLIWVIGVPSNSEETTQIGSVKEEIYNYDLKKSVKSPAFQAGLMAGDIILKVDDFSVSNASEVLHGIIAGTNRDEDGNPKAVLKVNRNGNIMDITTYPVLTKVHALSDDEFRDIGIDFASPVHVDQVFKKSPAEKAGLLPGDHIISVDDVTVYKLQDIKDHLQQRADQDVVFKVVRNDSVHTLTMRPKKIPTTKPLSIVSLEDDKLLQVVPLNIKESDSERNLIDPITEAKLIVFDVAGGEKLNSAPEFGDIILSVNDKEVKSLKEFNGAVNENSRARITYLNQNIQKSFTLPADTKANIKPSDEVVIGGFSMKPRVTIYPSPLKQFRDVIKVTYKVLNALFHPKSDINISHLSGPVGIGDLIYKTSQSDFRIVISITILLNINLAIINLLPIPVLDGGHMLIATINRIRKKNVHPMLVAYVQSTFMIILMGLMLYLVFNDSRRLGTNFEYEDTVQKKHQQNMVLGLRIPYSEEE